MFAFIWSCMVLAMKVALGAMFWSFAILVFGLIITFLIVLLAFILPEFKTNAGRKKDEDIDIWYER